jgi:beta-N-acetylhexosaminidase
MKKGKELITRREILKTGGVGVLGLSLAALVRAQEVAVSKSNLQNILSKMTVADKVGQLLMPYLDSETLEEKICHYRCGSLLIWGNLKGMDVRGFCELTNRAQTLSLERRKIPLWLHGYTSGLGWRPGWLGHAAKTAGPEEAEKAAEIFGRRWRAVGLHNLPEPCLNVPLYDTGIMLAWDTSKDPKVVRDFGVALTRGATRARCGTMAQHFPAHGATPLDSHKAYPVVNLDRKTLMRDHLDVYRACFEAGCTTICTAHLACPALDPDPKHIATTSRPILTDFLRGELGFQGVTIADAIAMYGFSKNGPPEEMSVDAVIAGCDCICITNSGTDMLEKVFNRLMKAVENNRLSQERLNEAVLRHLKFMEWLGLFEQDVVVSPVKADALLRNEQENQFLARIAGKENTP